MHYKRQPSTLLKRRLSSEGGFALVAAILACVILFALAMLVIQLSTQDLRFSAKMLGNEKALSAAETGIHDTIERINLAPNTWSDNPMSVEVTDFAFDTANAGGSVYTIVFRALPPGADAYLPMAGLAMGGTQSWGQRRNDYTVTGRHATYDTSVAVDVAFGFGPIDISTMYR